MLEEGNIVVVQGRLEERIGVAGDDVTKIDAISANAIVDIVVAYCCVGAHGRRIDHDSGPAGPDAGIVIRGTWRVLFQVERLNNESDRAGNIKPGHIVASDRHIAFDVEPIDPATADLSGGVCSTDHQILHRRVVCQGDRVSRSSVPRCACIGDTRK
ncbi:MAG: hypothetical protein E6H66_11895 [Betaproteobacteria bacterium]|nr:MAG: hypothetical protein E6H66_11895 [Betaproteobacteria bacterium]